MGALQAVVSVVPAFRRLLGTTPLGMADLGAIAAGVLLPLVVNEATKPAAPLPADGEEDEEQNHDEHDPDFYRWHLMVSRRS